MLYDSAYAADSLFGIDDKCTGNVTYAHRVDNPAHYNWCIVPNSGADAVLYGAVAVLVGCLVSGKLSSVWILVTGGLVELLAFYKNLFWFSNASALWLGMNPPDLFFYIFLPPLLLDAAIRLDWFTFRKMASQIITFAVGAVIGMVVIMTPILLYGFDLERAGWHWTQAALFVAMIASTDVVAVSAVIKKMNGPETLAVLLEGESLLNDATSLVMFEVFLDKVRDHEAGHAGANTSFLAEVGSMLSAMTYLSLGGAACGLFAGWITVQLMRYLRMRGMPTTFEVSVSVGMCYLLFYICNGPMMRLSGVIAVVVFGIYGSATLKWDMSAAAAQEDFMMFWDCLSQITNTIVFFFAGAASVNFFIRSADVLENEGFRSLLAVTLFRLPLIYLMMLVSRALLIALFSPMLGFFGAKMDWRGIVLCTMGGLRGALCLIMAQTVMLDLNALGDGTDSRTTNEVKSALALWTAGIVICTLLINAPSLSFVLRLTGLTRVSVLTMQMRDKARRAFLRHTNACVYELQQDEDELLQGVDWTKVREIVDCTAELRELVAPGGEEDLFDNDALAMYGKSGLFNVDSPPGPNTQTSPDESDQGSGMGSTGSSFFGSMPQLGASAKRAPFPGRPHPSSSLGQTSRSPAPVAPSPLPDPDLAIPSSNTPPGDAVVHITSAGITQIQAAELAGGERQNLLQKLDKTARSAVVRDKLSEEFNMQRRPSVPRMSPIMAPGGDTSPQTRSQGLASGTQSTALPPASFVSDLTQPLLTSLEEQEDADDSVKLRGLRKEAYAIVMDPALGFLAPCQWAKDSAHSAVTLSNADVDANTSPFAEGGGPPSVKIRPAGQPRTRLMRGDSDDARPSTAGSVALSTMELHHMAALPPGALVRMREEMKAESRMRALTGIKRYFYRKRQEGLLSSHGLRMLDNACDTCIDLPSGPINVFSRVYQDFASGPLFWIVPRLLFQLRRLLIHCGHIRIRALRVALTAPVQLVTQLLANALSNRMLVALEVAIEYWLALTFSIDARAVTEASSGSSAQLPASVDDEQVRAQLRREMQQEKEDVWQFILDRHLEAPDRFRAIQTYRAAMAVMVQQRAYIQKLYNAGFITEAEAEVMVLAVEVKERALRQQGAAWTPPSVSTSLRDVPFLTDISEALFEETILQGRLVKFAPGAVIHDVNAPEAPGIGIILSGLATTTVTNSLSLQEAGASGDGAPKRAATVYLTHGSVFGVLVTIAKEEMPGRGNVISHCSSRGTHVYQVPAEVIDMMEKRAEEGDADAGKLIRGLFRLASSQVLERFSDLCTGVITDALLMLKYSSSNTEKAASSTWASVRKTLSQRATERAAICSSQDAKSVWAALRSSLQTGQLVTLKPGALTAVDASLVLLKGNLEPQIKATNEKPAPKRVSGCLVAAAMAPCVLVWSSFEVQQGSTLLVKAGKEGASYVICTRRMESSLRRRFSASKAVLTKFQKPRSSVLRSAKGPTVPGIHAEDTSMFQTNELGTRAAGV